MKNNLTPLLLFALALFAPPLSAQTCLYLAYDGFDYTANTPLNALSGSTGWSAPWDVQGGNTAIPGYQINNGSGSLTYAGLQTSGRYATGGRDYLTSGRRLNTAETGPFSEYIAAGQTGIGSATGTVLWASALLLKDNNNSQPVWFTLHNDGNIPWCTSCASQNIAAGYFGSASDVSGQRRWSLALNGTVYPTTIPVTTGQTVFVVMRIAFNAGNTQVQLYVNPATLGNTTPATPTLTQTTGAANVVRSIGVYLGDGANNGAIDELRLAGSYACAAPDAEVPVNLPPVAVITPSATSGQIPLTITLSASASYDPEAQPLSYLWNFGDGTPTASGIQVEHTFNVLGLLPISLTVTDAAGLAHTTYQTITALNQNGAFPCQTTFTVNNPPTCNPGNNGSITINAASGVSFELRNQANALMPVSGGNQYHNLPAGVYNFTASSANGCADAFQLHLPTDSTTCTGWQPDVCAMDIGTNMSGFADWGVERPMKNLMKHVRPEPIAYTTTCFCWSLPVVGEMSFDPDGYPTHLPQTTSAGSNTVIRYVISSESPTGTNLQAGQTYVLLYDGIGTLEIGGGAVINSNSPGRIQFTINNNQANYMVNITASTMGNHVRNIRLLRLADEFANLNANPFYQGFIDKIAPFKMLRFMDWGHTNNNICQEWTDKTPLTHFTYAGPRGVPYEVMIQLANQTRQDVWICVPHLASNDYITQMATLFRDNLNPDLTIYLEYSNEVWNWIFDQAHYNDQNRPANLNYGRAYAEKAKNAFQIWHEVFGQQNNRVKRVLGIQVTYNYLNEQILSQLSQNDWDYGSPTHYFGLDHSAGANPVLTPASTPQNIIDNARNSWHASLPLFKRDYNQIKLFGKGIITYEGGQHFVGNVFGIPYSYQQAMWDSQYTPGIYHLYNEVLDTIRAWGCELAGNFSLASPQASVYGSWGALNDIDIQPPYMTTAPKYQSLLDNIPNRPTPVITGLATVCNNNTYTYSTPDTPGATYNWTVTGGIILSGQGTHQITVQWNSGTSGSVWVQQQNP